ncbi:MAG: DsbC family protein [Candidatus Moraniibacteriota bacterium]|nr:MAG: DsbC family protein [Candidatus Moranbacteria bacterium]
MNMKHRLLTALPHPAVFAFAIGIAAPSAYLAAQAMEPSESTVEQALKTRLKNTKVDKVDCSKTNGLCEVTAGTQIFYVDATGRFLVIGRVYDMETRQDLTAARLLEVNPDMLVGAAAGRQESAVPQPPRPASQVAPTRKLSLASLPAEGGIHWGSSSKDAPTVTVFSDFRCGYCRQLSGVLESMDVRVIERPISILGSRALANDVFCARDRKRAIKQAYAGEAVTDTAKCDTSPLDANEQFARSNALGGTPVIVRSDGAVLEGYRPRDVLAQWLKGAKS